MGDHDFDHDFQQIANHFFNLFLELQVQLDQGKLHLPKNYEKEVAQYKKLNAALNEAAARLAAENEQLEGEVAQLQSDLADLRRRLNETTINLGLANEKLKGLGVIRDRSPSGKYSFTELMDPESRQAFEQLMKEAPYRGTKDTKDER